MAETLEEHARAIAGVFERSEEDARKLRAFVEGFVRPHGLETPATPLLADAIEQLGELQVKALTPPVWVRIIRRMLKPATVRDRFEKKREWVH
jgi:hypothetical protein